jgi:hypothetical protein
MTDKPEFGECRIETIFDVFMEPPKLRIIQADERVRIARELLEQIDHPDVTYGDGILTIRGLNRTVSYGIGPYDLLTHTHEARLSPDPV